MIACAGAKVVLRMATKQTGESYAEAKRVLSSLKPEASEILPAGECPNRKTSFGSGESFSENRGGHYFLRFSIGCSREKDPDYKGRVAIIVRHGFRPTILIRHTDTVGGREVAHKLEAILQSGYKVQISSEILAESERLSGRNIRSELSSGFRRFVSGPANYITLACLVGILICIVWWLIEKKRRLPGFCCRCGYDLRGSTGERCSECGEPIPNSAETKRM